MKRPPSQAPVSNQEKNLLPADPNAERFFHYFRHGWDFIYKPVGGNWTTCTKYPIKPRDLWREHQGNKAFMGVRFGKLTNYGLLDVDIHSPYHPKKDPEAYQNLIRALRNLGIRRTITITSSDSGGIHIYFFLEEMVKSFWLACGLKRILTEAGFEIVPGWLELFPNTKRYSKTEIVLFNGHRLPLQAGSFILDQDLQPVSNALRDLIDTADWCAEGQEIRKLKATIKRAYQWYKETPRARDYSSEGSAAWYRDLDGRINEGWTGDGQTNEILKDLANFGWVFELQRTVEELADYMHQRAISLPGYKDWCGHKHQIKRRCRDWAKSAVNYWSPYPSKPKRTITYEQLYEQATNPERPIGKNTSRRSQSAQAKTRRSRQQINKERRQDSLERLKKVIAYLEQLQTLPQKIGELIKLICQTSKDLFNKGFSRKTLQSILYLPLWHPKYHLQETTSPLVDIPTPAPKKDDLSPINTEINNKTTKEPEALPDKEYKERPHSPQKPEKKEVQIETPEPSTQKDLTQKDPTIMKCFESPSPQDLDLSSKSSTNQEAENRDLLENSSTELESTTSTTNFELTERSPSVEEENQKNTSYELLSTDEKFELVESMVDRQYRFTWHQTSGMVQLANNNKSQLCNINKDTIVTVLDSYHSSVLGDGKRSLLVYVMPVKAVKQWLDGIAVPIDHLEPIESKIDLSRSTDVDRE